MRGKADKKVKLHRTYENKDGVRVPGVTTVLGLLAKPALIHWAWQCGVDGIDYRKKRDQAADIGTLAHYLIECEIENKTPDTSEYSAKAIDKAENAQLAFFEWCNTLGKYETVGTEVGLVSERYQYGGTLDWVIKQNGNYILIDFKTSKAVYLEMTYQLAAYEQLWNENNSGKELYCCYIARLGKEDGEFEQRRYRGLDNEMALFTNLREVYGLQKEIKKGGK